MNPDLPDVAVELGKSATLAFAARGGVDMARRAEADPEARSEAMAALQALGIDDIDARSDLESLAAAAAVCHAAGRVVLPYPVPALALRDGDLPFAVVPRERARVDHGDLFGTWRVATLDGRVRLARPAGRRLATKLGPFAADLEAGEPLPEAATGDVARHLALTAWQVLGTCDRAVELATEHVSSRVQFGKPLAALQAVQFQIADAAVAVAGLRELAHYTLWRVATGQNGEQIVDAIALRLHALDVARSVLRACQQLHGAAGMCDEYDISILYRHVQPALRLPFGAESAAAALVTALDHAGFDGLFPHGADLDLVLEP